MSRKIKKSVSILLALIMLCGVLAVAPVAASAEDLPVYETSTGGKYTLIPVDESDPENIKYRLHLISGSFTGSPWTSIKNTVLSVTAGKGVVFEGSCQSMFENFYNCQSVDLSNVDMTNVDSMKTMFNTCKKLSSIKFSEELNIMAKDMWALFYDCESLTSLDLSNFDMSLNKNSNLMFYNCYNLKELKFSEKFTGGITDNMKLNNGKKHDAGWITSDSTTGEIVSGTGNDAAITDPKYLPGQNETKTYVWIASTADYELIEDKEKPGMYDLHLIKGFFRGTTWQYVNIDQLIWTADDFARANVKSITATDKVKFTGSCLSMFENFSSCQSVDLSKVDTENVTSMRTMFNGCTDLSSIEFSKKFNTENVDDMWALFYDCNSLTSLDLSNFDMRLVKNSSKMFADCSKLKELTISDKFTSGIKESMNLKNGEYNENSQKYNGWRIKDDPSATPVSNYDTYAVITNPDYLPQTDPDDPETVKTKTYIWIGYYGVDWKNEGGAALYSEAYKEMAIPQYKGATPTNPDPEDTTSTFVGWVDDLGNEYGVNDVLPAVTRDTTYTARFDVPKTEYTLNYIYQGRSGGNKGGYVGDDGDTDEKTYTVTVELGESDLEESGMPKAKVLVDNAPVVNDPYKDCRWTFTDEYVEFDSENNIVTITAEQPERKYSVVFKDSNNTTTDVFRVKLNEFVKKSDSFITAEETDGSGQPFAYWSVTQNGKEVARCFEKRFNLRVTGDSVVTAHYGEAENLVTLSEAEISRQQFTENGTTKDLLYADFITAYMNKQGMELSTKSSSEYKTGMIVQYSPNVKVEKENAPGETLSENDKIKFASGEELTAADAKTIANGGTVGGKYSYLNAPIDNTKYNDKNRLNKSLVFTNTENARRLVLCAYYYVYNAQTDEIEMTAPVYFYLYDAGNAVNTES